MSNQELIQRFEELEAGRILGNLDSEEAQEWQELSKTLGADSDFSLELTAASLEAELLELEGQSMPAHLEQKLREQMADFVAPQADLSSSEKVVDFPKKASIWSSAKIAWAAAAVLAILLIASLTLRPTDSNQDQKFAKIPTTAEPEKLSPEAAKQKLVDNSEDVIQTKFTGTEQYSGMSGEVVWSDSAQEGYMTLAKLPPNDPSEKQYQLWIVDPSRDDKPVDGGVFDISTTSEPVVIAIRNPLLVKNPAAFVITLEQPGGVVVSKQEVVVAAAST